MWSASSLPWPDAHENHQIDHKFVVLILFLSHYHAVSVAFVLYVTLNFRFFFFEQSGGSTCLLFIEVMK